VLAARSLSAGQRRAALGEFERMLDAYLRP
jgi:hypothetical protein